MEFIFGFMIGLVMGGILLASSDDVVVVVIKNKKGKAFFVNYKDKLYKLLKIEEDETV